MNKQKTSAKKVTDTRVIEVIDYAEKNKVKNKKLPAIEIKDLVIDFGETLAVDRVSFDIEQGELVTLLGPSGCGKTTTLNAIAGLLTPTAGDIYFTGRPVTKLSPQRRKLGLVFQNYALYPHMSVYKNIAFPLYNDQNWKWSLTKSNLKIENLATSKELKFKGATTDELRHVKNYFENYLKVVVETKLYLNQVLAQHKKDLDILKSELGLLVSKRNSDLAIANRTTLEKIVDAKQDKSTKAQVSKEAMENLKLTEQKIKDKFKKEYLELKERIKEVQVKEKATPENKAVLKQAKIDSKKVPARAKQFYKDYIKELNLKYKEVELTDEQKDIVDSVKKDLRTIKQAVHEAIMEVAEKVDIVKNLKKKPTKLSGGQQQRVAIARAIVKKPKVLLMDEPLSNLDAKLRISTREWIKAIVRDLGMTTIFVTHDQEEAMSISDKIVCMSNGEVQQVGSPMELYSNPKNEFVAKFLGMPELQTFNATTDALGNLTLGKYKLGKFEHKSKSVNIGVRAEHILESTKKQGSIPAVISNIEYLGKEIIATAKIEGVGSTRVFLRNKESYDENSKINLLFPKSKIFIFDKKGRRL